MFLHKVRMHSQCKCAVQDVAGKSFEPIQVEEVQDEVYEKIKETVADVAGKLSENREGGSRGDGREPHNIGAALDNSPERSLGFQEELGLFKNRRLEQHALVLSQGWPSWTFGLEGLGFESVSTITAFFKPVKQGGV